MMKTYQGSCHCGAVRFEADLDLAEGAGKCNCSICAKTRNWSAMTKPEGLRVLAGEDDLGAYQFGSKQGSHFFCKTCGVHTFGRGHVEEIGGAYASVRLAALDGVEAAELAEVPVRYMDGRNNNWWSPPLETRRL